VTKVHGRKLIPLTATQALLFQSDSAPGERAREAADNDPHDDLANVHDLDATLGDLKIYKVCPENIAHIRTAKNASSEL
jgi:hypothetical protein